MGDKNSALKILASIDSPPSSSAALMVVAGHEDTTGVLEWLKNAGIETSDLDPDGKLFPLMRQLELSRWEPAWETLDVLTDQDLDEAPSLHRVVAITYLLSTVPTELRDVVLKQLPFFSTGLPIGLGCPFY